MKIENEFWSKKYENHIQLSDVMIKDCENQFEIDLPMEYINLLKLQNGGYTNNVIIDRENLNIEINEVFGIYFDDETPSITDSKYLIEEWGLENNQILISGDGHTWISLDYNNSDVPKVVYLNQEEGVRLVIGKTFEEFVEKLKISQ